MGLGIAAFALVDHRQGLRHADGRAGENVGAEPLVLSRRLPGHVAANVGDRPVQVVGDEAALILRTEAHGVVDAVLNVLTIRQLAAAAFKADHLAYQLRHAAAASSPGVAQAVKGGRPVLRRVRAGEVAGDTVAVLPRRVLLLGSRKTRLDLRRRVGTLGFDLHGMQSPRPHASSWPPDQRPPPAPNCAAEPSI